MEALPIDDTTTATSNKSPNHCPQFEGATTTTSRSDPMSPAINVDSEVDHPTSETMITLILVKSFTLSDDADDSATLLMNSLIVLDETVPSAVIDTAYVESDDNFKIFHLTNRNSCSYTMDQPALTFHCKFESEYLRVIPFEVHEYGVSASQYSIDAINNFKDRLLTLFQSVTNSHIVNDIVIENCAHQQVLSHSCLICLEKFDYQDECINHAIKYHNYQYHPDEIDSESNEAAKMLIIVQLDNFVTRVLYLRALFESNKSSLEDTNQNNYCPDVMEDEASVQSPLQLTKSDCNLSATDYSQINRVGLPSSSLPLFSQLPYSAYLSAGGSLPTPLGMSSMNPSQMSFLLNLAAQSQQHAAVVAAASSKLSAIGDKSSLPSFIKGTYEERSSLTSQALPVVSTPAGHCARNSNKTIKCPHCNWHYKYQETLEIHMRDKHPEFSSSVVGSAAANLQSTAASQCYYCQSKQQHPRLSRGETYSCGYKPYRCEVCNYSTTTKGNLSIHIQSDKHINNMHEHNQNLTLNANPSARMDLSTMTSNTPNGPVALPPTKLSNHQDLLAGKLSSGANFSLNDNESGDKLNPNADTSLRNDSNMSTSQPDMQELMLSAMNAAMRCWQVPNPLSDLPPNTSNSATVSSKPSQPMINHSAQHQYTGSVFLCNVCLEFSSNSLEEMHNHITMQRSGRADIQDDTMLYLEGYWHCRLCAYKSNLKANFQLHCKTDKHLQRQQLLNHVREGGAQNELRFSTLSTASPVQVRCNACNFFTTSAHKLRLHSVQPKHELCAALFHFLSEKEKSLLDGTGNLLDPALLVFECRLCGLVYSSKLELMQHLQTEQHERAYTTEQFQYQSQNQLMELHSIVAVNVNNSTDCSNSASQNSNDDSNTPITSSGLEICPLCKHSNLPNGLNLRQHMEKEHKIPSDFVEKFLKMAQLEQNSSSSTACTFDGSAMKAMPQLESDSDKENDFFRVTQEPDDESANAYLLPESKCKALEEDCLRCQHCVMTFYNIDDFYKHQSDTGHGETPSSSGFLCFKKGCNQYFQSIEYLKLHFHEIHAKSMDVSTHCNYPHICKLCHLLAFQSEAKLNEHTDLHAKLTGVTQACAHCEWQAPMGVATDTRSLLRQHLTDGHQVLRPKKSAESDRDLQNTPETNQRAPSLSALSPSGFSCPLQPDEAMSSGTHDSFIDPNRKFKCFACRIGFEKQIQLAAHTRSHSHKRLSMDSAGIDAQSVSNTTRYYDSSRKFKCEICVDAFSTRQQLYAHNNSVQHMKQMKEAQEDSTMAEENPFKCTVCDVSFKEKADFESHSMSVEHLTYMANISRLIQEGRLPQNLSDSLSTNLQQTPMNHSSNESTTANSNLQSSLGNATYPLNLLAMQYAAANNSKPLSMNPGFSPLLPVGVNPTLLPQFLHNMFYRFPFQNSSLPYFANPLQLPPQPPMYSPITNPPGMICPVCGTYVSGIEAMSQHPCFRLSTKPAENAADSENNVIRPEETKHAMSKQQSVKEEDANSNDSVDREIHRPLQICTESGSDSSRPLSTDSTNMNSLKSSLNEPHTLNPVLPVPHSKQSVSSTNAGTIMPSPGLNIPFFSAPASTNTSTSLTSMSSYQSVAAMSLASQVTPIYSTVTSASNADNAKRGRTRINEEQLKILRSFFDISNSPSDAKIEEMSQLTGLQCRVIKHWFRNTLFKERQRNKNSPYNFSVPPSTSLNLEEYEKTGRVEIKSEKEEESTDLKDIHDGSMNLDQNKNLKETPHDLGNYCDLPSTRNCKSERTASPESSASSISFSDTGTSEGEPNNEQRDLPDAQLAATNSTSASDNSMFSTNNNSPTTIMSSANLSVAVMPNLFNNSALHSNPGSSSSSDFANSLAASTWANYMQACKTTQLSDHNLSSTNALTANNILSLVSNAANNSSSISDITAHTNKSISNTDDGSSLSVMKSNLFKRKHREDDDDETPSGKRIRTTITPEQQDILLTYYQKDPNPSRKQMDVIAQQVDLSKRVVQVWFQNTRSRDRKGLLRNAGSQVLPISKRCPFCHVLFKVRNALEVHLLQCHGNKWSPAIFPVDTIPNESDTFSNNDQIKSPEVPQCETKMDDSSINDIPLDLSSRTTNNLPPISVVKPEELDDSHTIYWDEDSQECNVSGSDGGAKRNRTSISSSQLKVMKAILVHYKTPTNQECDLLGTYICLSRRVVQVWFQNQRAKEKKHMREINHLEQHMGSTLTAPPAKRRPLGKSYLVGDCEHPTGCELCEVFFDGTDSSSVQEHVLSADHLQRLVQKIHTDEKSDITNSHKSAGETGSVPSSQMSGTSRFSSPVSTPAWIISPQFSLNPSSKCARQKS